jgi:hypothetical protein
MEPFRGKYFRPVDQPIVEAVVNYLQRHQGITKVRDITFPLVRDVMKQLYAPQSWTPHPNSVFFVMNVMGHTLPTITDQEFEQAAFLYQRMEQLWNQYSGSGPNSCFSHAFVVSHIWTTLGRPEIAPYFSYPKEGNRTEHFTKVFRTILQTLQDTSTHYSTLPFVR